MISAEDNATEKVLRVGDRAGHFVYLVCYLLGSVVQHSCQQLIAGRVKLQKEDGIISLPEAI